MILLFSLPSLLRQLSIHARSHLLPTYQGYPVPTLFLSITFPLTCVHCILSIHVLCTDLPSYCANCSQKAPLKAPKLVSKSLPGPFLLLQPHPSSSSSSLCSAFPQNIDRLQPARQSATSGENLCFRKAKNVKKEHREQEWRSNKERAGARNWKREQIKVKPEKWKKWDDIWGWAHHNAFCLLSL